MAVGVLHRFFSCGSLVPGRSVPCIVAVCAALAWTAEGVGLRALSGLGSEPVEFVTARYGSEPGPTRVSGPDGEVLRLLSGVAGQQNVIAFPAVAGGPCKRLEVQWDARILPGADGYAMALLGVDDYGVAGPGPDLSAWEEPNLQGGFAVGFDIYDPPTDSPFDGNGNIHKRPQRQISLHVDGQERENRLCPVEFRGEEFQRIRVTVAHVCGGADVSVEVGGILVYDQVFVPDLLPYRSRLCFGARTGGEVTVLDLRNIEAEWRTPTPLADAPVRVTAFADVLLEWADPILRRVTFPAPEAGRIIMRYRLAQPEKGWDPWDRKASVRVRLEGDRWVEIARIITPYAREWEWLVDVTPYAPLLRGEQDVSAQIETWGGKGTGKGYQVSISFEFHPGRLPLQALAVEPLWQGTVEIGDPDKPPNTFFDSRQVMVPEGASAAIVRVLATGHGMNPNSKNAAEFMPMGRTLSINGESYEQVLWRDDCWLNPCRPQGGTWKYDRAGWAPGAVVSPWDQSVLAAALRTGRLQLDYRMEPYTNENRGKTHPPHHWVEAHVIFFADGRDHGAK